MAKPTRSKYIGLTFFSSRGNKWTVVRAKKTEYNNYRFNLSRITSAGSVKTISITSKVMKSLATGYTTIEKILENKQFQRDTFPSRAYRNTVWYTFASNGSLN